MNRVSIYNMCISYANFNIGLNKCMQNKNKKQNLSIKEINNMLE